MVTMQDTGGGYPQHVAVYAGKDQNNNIYVIQKPNPFSKPQVIKLQDVDKNNDAKFYNKIKNDEKK